MPTRIKNKESNGCLFPKQALLALYKGSCLEYPLKDIANDNFFKPNKINCFCEKTIEVVDKTGNKTGSHTYRFRFIIGTNKGLQNRYTDLCSQLKSFYPKQFETRSDEIASVEKAINAPDVIHAIIVGAHFITMKRNTQLKEERIKVIAAGSFQPTQYASLVLWLAVSAGTFNDKNFDYVLPVSNRVSFPKFRGSGLGTLLLAVIQEIQFTLHQNTILVLQANKEHAARFYQMHHFEVIDPILKKTEYAQWKSMLSMHYIDDEKFLAIMKSRLRVNELHWWHYQNSAVVRLQEDMIPKFLKTYLCDNIIPMPLDYRAPTLYAMFKKMKKDVKNSKLLAWQEFLDDDNSNDIEGDSKFVFATTSTYEELLNMRNTNKNEIFKIKQCDDTKDPTDSMFIWISLHLFGNDQYVESIRSLLSFIYRVLAQLDQQHPLFTSDNGESKDNYNMRSNGIVKDLYGHLYNHYKYRLNKPTEFYKCLSIEKEDREDIETLNFEKFNNPDTIRAACMVAAYFYQQTGKERIGGSVVDLAILSAIYNVHFVVIRATSTFPKTSVMNLRQRLWKISVRRIKRLSELVDKPKDTNYVKSCFLVFLDYDLYASLHLTKRENELDRDAIHVLPILRAIYYDHQNIALIRQKANEWIQNRKGKRLNVYNGHTIESLINRGVCLQNLLPILRILDPFDFTLFVKETASCVYATDSLSFDNLQSLQPKCYVINSVLDTFYEKITKEYMNDNKKILIISPGQVQLFGGLRDETYNNAGIGNLITKANLAEHILIQLHCSMVTYNEAADHSGHYINIDIDMMKAKKNQTFLLEIADSMTTFEKAQKYTEIIQLLNIDRFLAQFRPGFDFEYCFAQNITQQIDDWYECGIHGARRIYSYHKYGKPLNTKQIDFEIGTTNQFRIFIIEYILQRSLAVSLYVSPTGTGQTILDPEKPPVIIFPSPKKRVKPLELPDEDNHSLDTMPTLIPKGDNEQSLTNNHDTDIDPDEQKWLSSATIGKPFSPSEAPSDWSGVPNSPETQSDKTSLPHPKQSKPHGKPTPTFNKSEEFLQKIQELQQANTASDAKNMDINATPPSLKELMAQAKQHGTISGMKRPFASKDDTNDDAESTTTATSSSTSSSSSSSASSDKKPKAKVSKKQKTQPISKKPKSDFLLPNSIKDSQHRKTLRELSHRPPELIAIHQTIRDHDNLDRIVTPEHQQMIEADEIGGPTEKQVETYMKHRLDELQKTNKAAYLRLKKMSPQDFKINYPKMYFSKEQRCDLEYIENNVLKKIDSDIERSQSNANRFLNKYHAANPAQKDLWSNRYIEAVAEYDTFKYEKDRVPIFYKYDSIHALKAEGPKGDEDKWIYSAIVYNAQTKAYRDIHVFKDWLYKNMDRQFLTDFRQYIQMGAYVIFDGEGHRFVKEFPKIAAYQAQLQSLPMYQTGEDRCHYVRAVCSFNPIKHPTCSKKNENNQVTKKSLFSRSLIQETSKTFKWAVCLASSNPDGESGEHRYQGVTEAQLLGIIPDTMIQEFKNDATDYYAMDIAWRRNNPKSLTERFPNGEKKSDIDPKIRFVDRFDTKKFFKFGIHTGHDEEVCLKSPLGYVDQQQVYYWDMKTYPGEFYSYTVKTQISGIRYDLKTKTYFGLEHYKKGEEYINKRKPIPLEMQWVNENYKDLKSSLIAFAKKENRCKFYKVPLADVRQSRPTKLSPKTNPVIKYPQEKNRTCCFHSMCCALAYLKYNTEATALDSYRVRFFEKEYYDNFHRIMQCLVDFIRHEKVFLDFRRNYEIRHLRSSHQIIGFACNRKDMRLLQLAGDDGGESHAVCIVDKYIFDSNCKNALTLCQDGLDDCCNGASYRNVVIGYHFKKRVDD